MQCVLFRVVKYLLSVYAGIYFGGLHKQTNSPPPPPPITDIRREHPCPPFLRTPDFIALCNVTRSCMPPFMQKSIAKQIKMYACRNHAKAKQSRHNVSETYLFSPNGFVLKKKRRKIAMTYTTRYHTTNPKTMKKSSSLHT